MNEAVSDTGPILHLFEINKLFCLGIFEKLYIPVSVVNELKHYGLDSDDLNNIVNISVNCVNEERTVGVIRDLGRPYIHHADAEVFILGHDKDFSIPVLTDDMALRRHIEHYRGIAVGSAGVIIRSYHQGLMNRKDLEDSIDALFDKSTLHLSPAFRKYIRELISQMQKDM